MKEPLVSVIVPVYNVEKYLKRCVESILAQTYKNLEIILIDDGSTDGSGKMCDKWKEKDERVEVYHKQNGGLSDARNYGLDRAKGKYIILIDSDDYVADGYVEKLLKNMLDYKCDIATCGEVLFVNNISKSKNDIKIEKMASKEALEKMLYQSELNNSAWGKLYKKELFDGIRYPYGKIYEDIGTTYRLIMTSDSIIVSDEELYYYRQRKDAISKADFSRNTLDIVEMVDKMGKDVIKAHPDLEKAVNSRKLNAYYFVIRQMPVRDPERKRLIKKAKKIRRGVLFDEKVRVKTKVGIVISYLGFFWLPLAYSLGKNLNMVRRLE